ncbi:MAG: hypothetical protein [Caudoviricetes sp.]|nr:MAG: hypothetical protein [Caudoviricetes sp.]
MKTFDPKHIAHAANRLEELAKFGKRTLPDSVKKLYVEFLAPLTPEELDLCFKAWIFKSTRFPSAEELLACCGRSPTQKAEINWLTLDIKRDHIADEVCRQNQILSSLSLCGHGSEYEAGIARRELKKRFMSLYESEWFRWWTRGDIEAGESILDFNPKPIKQVIIADEDKLRPEDFKVLNKAIAGLTDKMGAKSKPKCLSLEEIAAIESELKPVDPSEGDETLPVPEQPIAINFDEDDEPYIPF